MQMVNTVEWWPVEPKPVASGIWCISKQQRLPYFMHMRHKIIICFTLVKTLDVLDVMHWHCQIMSIGSWTAVLENNNLLILEQNAGSPTFSRSG
jgi:hypothetical protein